MRMAMEYEVKVAIEDIDCMERKLRELGATLVDEVEEEDYYIDLRPCIDLRSMDMALRIRISQSRLLRKRTSELTFKGPKVVPNMKIRKEISVAVEDGYRILEIFKELGFRYYLIKKKRKIYRYGPYKIFLDQVHNLGNFLEVEVEGVDSVERFVAMIKKFVSILRISENFITRSYLEMILERVETAEQKSSN